MLNLVELLNTDHDIKSINRIRECKICRLGYGISKLEIDVKFMALFTLSMFRAIFKTLMHLSAFTTPFFNFEAYFKALIHLLKVQLGNFLLSQELIHLFPQALSGFVSFYRFCRSMLISKNRQ